MRRLLVVFPPIILIEVRFFGLLASVMRLNSPQTIHFQFEILG